MGQLIVSAQMTADSVMDHMEDWLDPELESEQDGVEQLRAADALILGRKTYEGLAAYWPNQEGTHAELVNPIPKYVASHTIKEPLTWNSQLLGTDPADEVAALKEQHVGDLVSYGCGELANYLARRGLVDKVTFWLHAVVWGDGVRAFHAGPLPVRLRLISATTYTSGVVKLSYQPLGAG